MILMNNASLNPYFEYLHKDFHHTLRDPLWKDIFLTPSLKRLTQCGAMQKLRHILQLGPTSLLYPGAVHTRYGHSLGVYHATRLFMLSLASKTLPLDITRQQLDALLVAALLHDLGHFPYAHALKDVVVAQHEALGAQLIAQNQEIKEIIEHDIETDTTLVQEIIDTTIPTNDPITLLFRNILSGTLDPDKIDYLSRDALYCGVPYGIQDASYVIRNLVVTPSLDIGLESDAIGSVEHLLFSKYSMYRNVYWHSVVRSATAMIKKAFLVALKEGSLQEEDVYHLDDDSFHHLLTQSKTSPTASLFEKVRENKLLKERGTFDLSEENTSLTSFTKREETERHVYEELRSTYPQLHEYEVIIDVPEPISFETEIQIKVDSDTFVPFSEVSSLFSNDGGKVFSSSLRKGRLFLPSYVEKNLSQAICSEVTK